MNIVPCKSHVDNQVLKNYSTHKDYQNNERICLDDFSRVKLKEIPGEEGSDYINASFLDVSCRPDCVFIPVCYYQS